MLHQAMTAIGGTVTTASGATSATRTAAMSGGADARRGTSLWRSGVGWGFLTTDMEETCFFVEQLEKYGFEIFFLAFSATQLVILSSRYWVLTRKKNVLTYWKCRMCRFNQIKCSLGDTLHEHQNGDETRGLNWWYQGWHKLWDQTQLAPSRNRHPVTLEPWNLYYPLLLLGFEAWLTPNSVEIYGPFCSFWVSPFTNRPEVAPVPVCAANVWQRFVMRKSNMIHTRFSFS